jgi:hypothetical protein
MTPARLGAGEARFGGSRRSSHRARRGPDRERGRPGLVLPAHGRTPRAFGALVDIATRELAAGAQRPSGRAHLRPSAVACRPAVPAFHPDPVGARGDVLRKWASPRCRSVMRRRVQQTSRCRAANLAGDALNVDGMSSCTSGVYPRRGGALRLLDSSANCDPRGAEPGRRTAGRPTGSGRGEHHALERASRVAGGYAQAVQLRRGTCGRTAPAS